MVKPWSSELHSFAMRYTQSTIPKSEVMGLSLYRLRDISNITLVSNQYNYYHIYFTFIFTLCNLQFLNNCSKGPFRGRQEKLQSSLSSSVQHPVFKCLTARAWWFCHSPDSRTRWYSRWGGTQWRAPRPCVRSASGQSPLSAGSRCTPCCPRSRTQSTCPPSQRSWQTHNTFHSCDQCRSLNIYPEMSKQSDES